MSFPPRTNSIKNHLFLFLGCVCLALCASMAAKKKHEEALAAKIAPEILRLHILAESDSPPDQQVKLEIRSLLLDFLKSRLPENAGKEDTIFCLQAHRQEIESLANQYLQARGFPYGMALSLENCYFPTRAYGEFTFPCGYYDAARVILGRGKGHNWWCVIYPQFCFADAVCTGIPAKSSQILKEKIDQDDFLELQGPHPDLKLSFHLLPNLAFGVFVNPGSPSP